jgi:hypothetical protein
MIILEIIKLNIHLFVTIIFLFSLSKFLFNKFYKSTLSKFSFEEHILIGIILISLISFILNFFLPLNFFYCTIILCVVLIISFKEIEFLKKNITNIIFILIISNILIIYSTVNRPDAWLYHIPFTKIVNETKIFPGIANINQRFGWISIFQYTNAFFINYFFKANGIHFASIITASSFFLFVLNNIKNLKNLNLFNFSNLIIFIFICIRFNRYSDYGNDHLVSLFYLYFYLKFIYFFSNKTLINLENLLYLFFISIFIFFQKITYIIPIVVSFYFLNIYFFKKIYVNKNFLLISTLIFLWILKNILISGCLIYPLKITCNEKLPWYSNDNKFIVSAESTANGTEAWSKAWPAKKNSSIKTFEEWNKNYNWLKTWYNSHFPIIIEKLLPPFLIIFFMLIFKIIYNKEYKLKLSDKIFIPKQVKILFYLNILYLFFLWFNYFPVLRFGLSHFIIVIIYISSFFIISTKEFKFFKLFILLSFLFFVNKNLLRIIQSQYSLYPEIEVNINNNDFEIINDIKIYIGNDQNCGYKVFPCSAYKEALRKIEIRKAYNYKYIFLKR